MQAQPTPYDDLHRIYPRPRLGSTAHPYVVFVDADDGATDGTTATNASTVLVVEDEPAIADALAARLRAEGFTVVVVVDGPSGVAADAEHRPDLIVLDVMLPGFDGLEVCRRVQAQRPVPVLMLTARDDEADTLMGLAAGADDYLTKPFSLRGLVARVHALLRRVRRAAELAAEGHAAPTQRLGDLDIDLDRAARRVRRRGAEVHLTPLEFDLLGASRPAPARSCPANSCSPRCRAGRTPPAPAPSAAT